MTWPEALVAVVFVICVTVLTLGMCGAEIKWTKRTRKGRDEA